MSATLFLSRVARLAVVLLPCLAPIASAHEFKLDLVVTTFVRIDDSRAHALVRVPIELVRSAKLPAKGAEIDVANAGPAIERAVKSLSQDVTLYENGRPLIPATSQARLSLPSDRSFEQFARAEGHIAAAPEPDLGIVVDQGYIDVHFTYPIASPASVFAIESRIARDLGPALKLSVRFIDAEGNVRPMLIDGHARIVALNPGWIDAMSTFVALGIGHILRGADHLLFLLCVLMPLRRVRPILAVVTGFTLAHSVTLIGAATGWGPAGAWFPPFVEMVIALSIVYMALENIMDASMRRRLVLTMLFGLVHGFGFSYGLRQEMQFAGAHLVAALLAFNIGIEIGQLLALVAIVPLLAVVRRFVFPHRTGGIILAALVAYAGLRWAGDRWEEFGRSSWPVPDAGDAGAILAAAAVVASCAVMATALARWWRLDPPVTMAPRSVAGDD